jgi:hypothetical protein
MRYVFRFGLALALGLALMAGCSNENGEGGSGGTAGTGGTGGMPECMIDQQCDDGEECTTDECTDGMCQYTAVEDGIPCDEGNECNAGMCAGGVCDTESVADGTACDERNECDVGMCAGGACDTESVADGTACGDGAGTCQEGSCVGTFACTEQGIREAIAVGGGPHTFDCDGPTTVMIEAEIVVDNDVVLDGEGNLTVDGSKQEDARDGLFVIERDVSAQLSGFTVIKGSSGGIMNGGTLTLTDTVVAENASYGGGGITNGGALTLINTTVSGNTAEVGGGGIANFEGTTVTLINSTVSGNTAEYGTNNGGGIGNDGRVTLINSTVSGNTPDGIGNAGTLTLINTTVSGNVDFLRGSVTVYGSLVDGDCGGVGDPAVVISNGHNIESPGNSCGFDQDTDQVEVTAEQLNLGPLADNGGPTMTHALLTEPEVSVAIDVISDADCVDAKGAPLTTDQRGEPRPETGGTKCDVGAFELQP